MITAIRAPSIAIFRLEDELNMPESFSDPANGNNHRLYWAVI